MERREEGRKSQGQIVKRNIYSVPTMCQAPATFFPYIISIDFHKTMVLLLAHFIDKKTEAQRCEVTCPR